MCIEYVLKDVDEWLSSIECPDYIPITPYRFISLLEQVWKAKQTKENLHAWETLLGLLADRMGTVLKMERKTGWLDRWIYKRLPVGPVVLVGDLHGDIESMKRVLIRENLWTGDRPVVFMGDYIDRGLHSLPVLVTVLMLKAYWGDRVIVLKGNHEEWVREDEIASAVESDGNGLWFLNFYWKDNQFFSGKLLERLYKLFEDLPVAVLIDDLLIAHGSPPKPVDGKEDYKGVDLQAPESRSQMLWGDPENKDDVIVYGTRFRFARAQLDGFTKETGIRCIIRAHEQVEQGYKLDLDNRVLTIFSSGGKDSYYKKVDPAYGVLRGDEVQIKSIYETMNAYKYSKVIALLKRIDGRFIASSARDVANA